MRGTFEAPVSGDTVIVLAENKLLLLVVTVRVKDASVSISVGDTVTTKLLPSSNTADGSDIGSNTGASFVLVTVMVKVCVSCRVPSPLSVTVNTTV